MMSVDGIWKRIMELAIFLIGWQTSAALMAPAWMVLSMIYLFYVLWQIYNEYDKEKLRWGNETKNQV